MHSFTVKAALAAFLISTSLAGANAASGPGGQGHENHGHSFNHNRADLPDMSTPMSQPAETPAATQTHDIVAPHQRLAGIEDELGAASHRITVDQRHGYLTAAEARQLRHEGHIIRNPAYHAAQDHHGRVPRESYDRLQGEVHHLDRDIHRDATNA